MKKIGCIFLTAVLLLGFAAEACAIHLENQGNIWFLPDGRIVQTKRVFTGEGSEYPEILCMDQTGKLLWSHVLGKTAVGRSYCQLLEDGTIAFMYHDENRQYFAEYLNPQGALTAKGTWETYTKDGLLFENGMIFCEKYPQQEGVVLNIHYWDERETHWVFREADQITLYSAAMHGDRLYIELNSRSSENQTAHGILCIDPEERNILWTHRLETDLLLKAYTGNERGGITLFVQTDAPNDQYEMHMITLDEWGMEASSAKVDGIPATMAMNVVDAQENGLYHIWGYGYDTYGENAIISAVLTDQGKVVERNDFPVEYGTCVRYLNDELYVMIYENGIESFELLPLAQLAP